MIVTNNEVGTIILDLDGTLFDDSKNISQENIEALSSCIDAGIQIAFATARPLNYLSYALPEKLFRGSWKICHNGAQLISPAQEFIYKKSIPLDLSWDITSRVMDKCHSMSWYHEDEWISSTLLTSELRQAYNVDEHYPMPKVADPLSLQHLEVEKLLIVGYDKPRDLLKEFEHQLSIYFSSREDLLMISAPQFNKGVASSHLLEHIGSSWKNALVFGNDHNDIPMFKAAHYSVAMENSEPELIPFSTLVTGSNNDPKSISNILRSIYESI